MKNCPSRIRLNHFWKKLPFFVVRNSLEADEEFLIYFKIEPWLRLGYSKIEFNHSFPRSILGNWKIENVSFLSFVVVQWSHNHEVVGSNPTSLVFFFYLACFFYSLHCVNFSHTKSIWTPKHYKGIFFKGAKTFISSN